MCAYVCAGSVLKHRHYADLEMIVVDVMNVI